MLRRGLTLAAVTCALLLASARDASADVTAFIGITPPPSIDPAAATFTSDAGLLVVSAKPDKTADYEAAIRALQDAL